jgi:DNA ligase 1
MPEIALGETVELQGSAKSPYILKNVGGVYSCSCPAWRNQSLPIDRRTCKHLIKYRGQQAEAARIGNAVPAPTSAASKSPAPPLLLAHSWDNEQDVKGWHMSEKLDGVRAYWNGKQFVSRQGNVFHAPTWFTKGLPSIALDGEIWMDRKKFQQTVSIVRRQDGGDLWKSLIYAVFDAPGSTEPFETRLKTVQDIFRTEKAAYGRALYQVRCEGMDHLQSELARINALGGEGLMLRQPGSAYEAGRSNTLLKVKTFHDSEAHVVEHLPGAGKHKGRLGALLVELPNGKQFSVGTGFSDAERENPPAIGTLITFRFQEFTDGGIPRFPAFVRLRTDQAQPRTLFA